MVRWWAVAGLASLASSFYCVATDNRWFYRHIVMKALQVVDAETAHVTAIRLAQLGIMPKYRSSDDKILARDIYNCSKNIISIYVCSISLFRCLLVPKCNGSHM